MKQPNMFIFIKNLSKCRFLVPVKFCETGGECLGIPLNHGWLQLIAPTHLFNMCCVVWFSPRRKLILAYFLHTNGKNFDLLRISELLYIFSSS